MRTPRSRESPPSTRRARLLHLLLELAAQEVADLLLEVGVLLLEVGDELSAELLGEHLALGAQELVAAHGVDRLAEVVARRQSVQDQLLALVHEDDELADLRIALLPLELFRVRDQIVE